jgi:hypothetical protein
MYLRHGTGIAQSVQRLGYALEDRGSISGGVILGFFSLRTVSRPTLGSTQPPLKWEPGAFTPGVKRPGRESDHSSPSNAEVKN